PQEMPGVALVDGGTFANDGTAHVYAENDFEGIVLQAVRTHTEKLIAANENNPRGLQPAEYYDLASDREEAHNLCDDTPDRVEELRMLLDGMMAFIREGAAEPAVTEGLSEDLTEQLEALGYGGHDIAAPAGSGTDSENSSEAP
ncbi:MAG TPA: hypothetical protein PLD73_15205, partial [Candidatus Hydrogenedentes bacterium]|nr:hypothetical protein [Candidatus Hydrogenedentota bacterium]